MVNDQRQLVGASGRVPQPHGEGVQATHDGERQQGPRPQQPDCQWGQPPQLHVQGQLVSVGGALE